MKTVKLLVTSTLLFCSVSLAGGPNPYSGTWNAKMVNNKGETRKGTVLLNEQDGAWDIEFQNVKNPCAGLRAPIVIRRASEEELVFEIVRSKALRGCKDNVASLKRINESTVQGELDDGRKLTLTRE